MKLYKYDNNRCNISGNKIKELREQTKMSQEQLAARLQLNGLNLNQKAISRIETGDRIIPDYELLFFAQIFHVPVSLLLDEENFFNKQG